MIDFIKDAGMAWFGSCSGILSEKATPKKIKNNQKPTSRAFL